MRCRSTTKRETIVYSEQFVEAWLWQYATQLDQVLEVNSSPIVKYSNPLFEPVFEFLARHCHRELNWARVEDEMWVRGEYIHVEHLIFAACPGKDIDHNCHFERKESLRSYRGDGWLSTDPSHS